MLFIIVFSVMSVIALGVIGFIDASTRNARRQRGFDAYQWKVLIATIAFFVLLLAIFG